MSAIYNLEPQPTASCILRTTSGDISLELFAQQTPLTARNFLQHCLDGYYDNTIFHRLVPGFILQGGDPTGTGNGGESIYDGGALAESREAKPPGVWPMEERTGRNAGIHGVGFKDEFHSRLKYNRRGLLGMANEGPDSNGSQFFFTLAATPELQGKNTIFGRVAGDTIYNVAKMGEAEVDPNTERPLYPTKITSTEVLVNPFKDMVARKRTAAPIPSGKPSEIKKKKRKGGKQLLSFGDEEAEDDIPILPTKKAKFDSRIVTDAEESSRPIEQKNTEAKVEKRTEKPIKKRITPTPSPSSSPVPEPITRRQAPRKEPSRSPSSSPEPMQKVNSLLEQTNAQIAELKASMRRSVQTAPAKEKKKSALEQMIPATSIRGRKRTGQTSAAADQQSLQLLKAFQSRLENAASEEKKGMLDKNGTTGAHSPSDVGKGKEEEEEAALCDLHFIADCQSCKKWDDQNPDAEQDSDDDRSWMSHALSFQADKLGKDLNYRKKAEEELVIIDPREKARTLKEERRAEREAKAGNSGRAWDQARNEKLARASAFAGRGAK